MQTSRQKRCRQREADKKRCRKEKQTKRYRQKEAERDAKRSRQKKKRCRQREADKILFQVHFKFQTKGKFGPLILIFYL